MGTVISQQLAHVIILNAYFTFVKFYIYVYIDHNNYVFINSSVDLVFAN